MSGYTRQSAADIVTGAEILAAPLNNEFNAIEDFADGSTGHNHSGGTGQGPKLSLTAAVEDILPVENGGTGVDSIEDILTELNVTPADEEDFREVGTAAAQTVFESFKWPGQTSKRWSTVLEGTAAYALYSYSADGGTVKRPFYIDQDGHAIILASTSMTALNLIDTGADHYGIFQLGTNLSASRTYTWSLPNSNATYTWPSATTTLVGHDQTQTLTNKRITPRVTSETSNATPSVNSDNIDVHRITALAANITSVTVTGTPTHGQKLIFEITGTATRTIVWGSSFEASGNVPLPTTTSGTVMLTVGFFWNSATSKWRCVAVA
jgi:hypothetical protein